MPLRRFLHIPHRVLRLALLVLAACVLVFVGLTRTQVGRDALRDELERQFAARYNGRLEIETLRGNLLYDLFAGGVRLYDPAGNVILSADSAVVHPSWRDLFRRTISAPRIHLVRPELLLIRQPDGTWSISQAFARRTPSSPNRPRWSFSSADVSIENGRVVTRNLGDAPAPVADSTLFDYTNAEVRSLHARAVVELDPDLRLVDVLSLEAELPGASLAIASLRGQFVLEDGRLAVNGLELRAGGTEVDLNGMLDLGSGSQRTLTGATEVEVELSESRFDFDQLRRFFPRLPVAASAVAEARLHGTLAHLTIDRAAVRRGRSDVAATGSLRGLPDSLAFDVAFDRSALNVADLQSLLPRADLKRVEHLGMLRLSLHAIGALHRRPEANGRRFAVAAKTTLESQAGRLAGDVRLSGRRDGTWTYETDLTATSLDLSHITRNARLASRLNGRLTGKGTGNSLARDLEGYLNLALTESRFAGRTIDSLRVDARIAQGIVSTQGMLLQGSGAAAVDLQLDLASDLLAYQARAATYRLDVGPLLLSDSVTTRLNTVITLDGSGRTLDELGGILDIHFGPSTLVVGRRERALPAHRLHAELAQHHTEAPRLEVSGDVGHVRLEGDVALKPLVALVRLWGEACAASIADELRKPYRSPLTPEHTAGQQLSDDPFDAFVAAESDRLAAQRALAAAGLAQQTIRADVEVLRSDLIAAYLPGLPDLAAGSRLALTFTAGPDALDLKADLQTDSLCIGSVALDALQARLTSTATLARPLRDSFVSNLSVKAGQVRIAGQAFNEAHLAARYAAAAARIDLGANEHATAPLRLAARLDLLPDRNRFTLTDLQLAASTYAWSNAGRGVVDLYADAVVIPGLTLENRTDTTQAPQRVHINGVLSYAPVDTLHVSAEGIQLRSISDLAALSRPIGGRLDGRLALTGIGHQPEVTGAIDIETLSLDNRILGHVALTSRYVPGQPDVTLDLLLTPSPDSSLAFVPGTQIPAIYEPSHLRLSGTFRLPQRQPGGTDPGALDLKLDVERADAFFFDYIFDDVVANVAGGLAGQATITGSFYRPLFDGVFDLEGGQLDVPKFNLHYGVNGRARVDRYGIHLDGVRVTDRTGGRGVVSGGILFNDYRYFSFDLRGNLNKVQIIDVRTARDLAFYGQIWASGDVTLTGPVDRALLRSTNAVATPESNVFIPLTASTASSDVGFIVFADSTGQLPDLSRPRRRENLLAQRPADERPFVDGLEMDLNILASEGSTVNLVIDPLVGDVIRAVGGGRIQLQRIEGDFQVFGALEVTAGDYLFSAGELFYRRFLIDSGTIAWDGDPLNASLDLNASYRTRASTAGLDLTTNGLIPLVVHLHVTGRVATPAVDLRLAVDRNDRSNRFGSNYEGLEAVLNQPEHAAQYATSVMLTNSFLLTTELQPQTELADTRNQLAFNSLSQLVATQLNRYLNQAVPNLDLNFGVQGESTQDLDVTYGVALRLLDERLIIRGQGIYQNDQTRNNQRGLLDEFVVEVRLNPNVSVEVFYRREDDLLGVESNTSTTGAGLSYETQFATWGRFWRRLFGWRRPEPEEQTPPPPDQVAEDVGE